MRERKQGLASDETKNAQRLVQRLNNVASMTSKNPSTAIKHESYKLLSGNTTVREGFHFLSVVCKKQCGFKISLKRDAHTGEFELASRHCISHLAKFH